MSQVRNGDTVKVTCTGRLADGSVFYSTENREPLQFTLGSNQLIKGFETALLGMEPGESKTIEVPPEEAYGPRRDEMVMTIERSNIPPTVDPRVGQRFQLQSQDGGSIDATVTRVTDSDVTLDANHPLAGRALTFEIALLEIE